MSAERSPALIIRFPAATASTDRDRLVALLADHDLVAIQEDDVTAPRAWTAHFATAAARDAAGAAVAADGGFPFETQPLDVEDEDWARRTQADLPAVRVGRIIVAPPWDLPDAAGRAALPPDAIVVEIEPSRGFGTGHHQSTRLCLALLQSRDLGRRTVIDVGTGSGVLAIAAARLGAAFVSAIDHDPDAVENARENVTRNGVDGTVEVHVRDLTGSPLPAADLVTANLTGTLLARHAGLLIPLVRPGGSLIVSGFTLDEQHVVLDAFSASMDALESAEEDGWWAYVFAGK